MPMRALLVLMLAMVGVACAPPCEPITTTVGSVCHRADAGPIAPDASFVLEGRPGNYGTVCDVSFSGDGGTISLEVTGSPACDRGGGAGLRAAPAPVSCTIPPLAAGTYTVLADTSVTLTIPPAGTGGIAPCD